MSDSNNALAPNTLEHAGPYFFCGIGGSGMLPLALIVKARGYDVEAPTGRWMPGAPQAVRLPEGARHRPAPAGWISVTRKEQLLVTSAAVEDTVQDVVAAKQQLPTGDAAAASGAAGHSAKVSIAVGGTSGKSTTTGMIGWILYATRRDPTVMNGAVMKNFVAGDFPFASAIVGEGDIFVSEVDESDGSIALYNPTIAVLNNIALDHKSMDELRRLFTDFVSKAQVAVLNLDNDETKRLAAEVNHPNALTFADGYERRFFGLRFVTQPMAVHRH
jgi:UDP-N-acetylmuramate--alanine ligase